MENSEEFKDILTRIRKERLLTQEAMAEKIGVHIQTVRDYEKGRRKPSIEKLEEIASKLGISSRELFKGESESDGTLGFPVSKLIRRISAIPDEVYDLAAQVPLDSDAWTFVIVALELEIKKQEAEKAKKKKSKA